MTRILVVDDDADLRETLHALLSDDGYEVISVADAAAAFEAIEHERPNTAIVDLSMPGTSGVALCRVLKSDDAYADLCVIVLTGGEWTDELLGYCDAFLKKPIDKDRLFEILDGLALSRELHVAQPSTASLRW